MLKFSDACERNKDPILKILKHGFNNSNLVLEIGSGTAQHAVYFGKHLSHLNWQPTDLNENLASIKERIDLEATDNVKPPVELDVSKHPWPVWMLMQFSRQILFILYHGNWLKISLLV